MNATRLLITGGGERIVQGRTEDVSAALRPRTSLGQGDDGRRRFVTVDGDLLDVHRDAVILAESAKEARSTRQVGFAAALEGER